jgi:selenocysteine lyase/cysteine desulfurase
VFKAHYSRFLSAQPDRLHFAAHSHHLWPDVTRDAVVACWDDAARWADRKWEHVFEKVVPEAQAHVARLLDLSHPRDIAFAPSTHELVGRILSCFEPGKRLRVLTTDSEFHSFARQAARLEEAGFAVERVPALPFETFDRRFREAAAGGPWDLVYLSHVFFNSGFVVRDLEGIVRAVRDPATVVVIDGYHSFCAIPVSLRGVEDRAFFLAGGYKYAQSGEGVCPLVMPHGCALRPMNTGWFATFGTLTRRQPEKVQYSDDGFRFWGATYDPAGLYRFNAVMGWLQKIGMTIERLDAWVRDLMEHFLKTLERLALPALPASSLVTPRSLERQGHFLVFQLPDAPRLFEALSERGVDVDLRADRLRFGFGLYQDRSDVDRLAERLRTL